MKFKEKTKYSVLSPTSMGVRLTPYDRQPIHLSNHFGFQATSAETNVLSPVASLGLPVKIITRFVKDSPIAFYIKSDLRKRNIDFEGTEIEQAGPWGYRHQFNIADSGYGVRAPEVFNDRAGEVGRTISIDDFDLDKIFVQEGVKILHLSGLIVSLSEQTAQLCLALVKKAKETGTKVSFDLNYRPSFWKDREKELFPVFQKIASLTDILIGNEEEYQLALGLPGPEIGNELIHSQIDRYQHMINELKTHYPNVEIIATTLRDVIDSNRHLFGAMVNHHNEWVVIEQKPIDVLDRIGGGDGFVGGFLYGLLKGWSVSDATKFGWANGAYAVTLLDDFTTPQNEEVLWNIWNGNSRVNR
ncbi:MAG: sugar kinase [Firmicutes bacterium]|nr:sugar kinase [Bacillota bacterium]